MLSKKIGDWMFKTAIALTFAGLLIVVSAGEGHATSPLPPPAFTTETEAEGYWADTGYPVCYSGGNGYYWDGYSYVWYPCPVY